MPLVPFGGSKFSRARTSGARSNSPKSSKPRMQDRKTSVGGPPEPAAAGGFPPDAELIHPRSPKSDQSRRSR